MKKDLAPIVKIISGEDCSPEIVSREAIKETLNELPVRIRNRYKKRFAITDRNGKFIKLTDKELAKQIGCSERTLRNDNAEAKRIYNKKLENVPRPNPSSKEIQIPFSYAKTDRTFTCPQCGTTFPKGMKETNNCPFCGTKLERGLTVNIIDPVTEEIKKTIRKKVKEKIDTSDD